MTQIRKVVTSFFALSLLLTAVLPVQACAPDLAYAILVNGNHPDLPLKLYSKGNLGIIQPGWAKSYLIVAYRYLNSKPLNKSEQESVVRLWHRRITNGARFSAMQVIDERDAYLALRAKAIGANPKQNSDISWKMDKLCYEHDMNDSTMRQARLTLNFLLQKYGVKSKPVVDWVSAQDGIFGVPGEKIVAPLQLTESSDAVLMALRNYQIGAANYYLGKQDLAIPKFEAAEKVNSPVRSIASYMVLRCRASEARLAKGDSAASAIHLLTNEAARANNDISKEDIWDLLRPLNYLSETSESAIKLLSKSVLSNDSPRFGGDVGDLTFLLDGNPLHPELSASSSQSTDQKNLADSSDLADWVLTLQDDDSYAQYDDSAEAKTKTKERERQRAEHALAMWRKNRSTPWLVAALIKNGLYGAADSELLEAAELVPSTSPAYLTCRFYVVDHLIAAGKFEEARSALQSVVPLQNLPPSTKNLLRSQMAATSKGVIEFLKSSIQAPPEILSSITDIVTPKFFKDESGNSYVTQTPAFDAAVADDLSRNAPLSTWVMLSESKDIDSRFKAVLLRSVWTRAFLLGQNEQALKVTDALAESNPVLRGALNKFKSAPNGAEQQFAAACVVLRNFGMSPYLHGGAERHGEAVNEFDWYNGNFWVPFPLHAVKSDELAGTFYDTVATTSSGAVQERLNSYDRNGLSKRLNTSEKRQGEIERALILKNHPSRFLGTIVLNWAKLHPTDAAVPEMLYRVVILPKWTAESEVGSEYSKKAYIVLHRDYAGNKWTRKAVCYY